MTIPRDGRPVETVTLASDRDVALARKAVSRAMDAIRARTIRKTRFVTAVSEIARNAVAHGGGGSLSIYAHEAPPRISVTCEDRGRGIEDVERALTDGYTTAGSMGRGLGGAKRLADGFEIDSVPGRGTIVRMLGRA